MNKIRVTSDGTAVGTKVMLPDGTDIASHASLVEIIVAPGEPVRVVVTYSAPELDVQAGDDGTRVEMDPVARHNARRL